MTRTVTFEDPSNLPGAKALKELGDFCFRKVGGRVLLTNDWGYHATLSEADFETFVQGRLPRDGAVWLELKKKGFLRGHRDLKDLAAKFAAHHPYLWKGPSLHIVVVTLRCNLKCVYCHSSVVGEAQREFDMTLDTARRSVDMIFESPNPSLMIEFQGGEPMMNWPVVKFVAEYARKKNRTANRQLKLMMVSNLTLLDEEKLAACADLGISICTSLDGPASVHDANRIHLGGNSHAATARWLERLVKSGTGTGALMTTTRKSLSCAKEIVDEYRRLGLGQIFVRPLHYLGFAKKSWHVIGYEDAEFIAFYRETLDYAIDLNRGGQAFTEATATMLLRKILLHDDPGYVDLRSPCGATLGQVSYNYDGGVYTCDEGRMIGADGDQTFKIGDVRKDRFADVVNHPGTKACCVASSLEAQPLCHTCTYKPYCGICPVLNYATQDSIWGQMPTNSYCYDFMHIFDALFERLQDPERKKVLESWVGIRPTSLEPSCAGRV